MPKSRELTNQQRAEIVHLFHSNASTNHIANTLNINASTVRRIIQRYRQSGSADKMSRKGRPTKITTRTKRLVRRILEKAPRTSLKKFYPALSVGTVRKIIRQCGYGSRIAAKKPWLSKRHMRNRMKWARKHLLWSAVEWETVIWSDECCFELVKNQGKFEFGGQLARIDSKQSIFHLLSEVGEYLCTSGHALLEARQAHYVFSHNT